MQSQILINVYELSGFSISNAVIMRFGVLNKNVVFGVVRT